MKLAEGQLGHAGGSVWSGETAACTGQAQQNCDSCYSFPWDEAVGGNGCGLCSHSGDISATASAAGGTDPSSPAPRKNAAATTVQPKESGFGFSTWSLALFVPTSDSVTTADPSTGLQLPVLPAAGCRQMRCWGWSWG